MNKERFNQIEKRNQNDKLKLCFELYCETFNPISYNDFTVNFEIWLTLYAGKTIDEAVRYFKENKVNAK